jgi:hypothetical protein
MKLSILLSQRQALLRQARLANLAFAYAKLGDFAGRIARARLTGEVSLRHAAPEAECYWATLTARAGRQSVIEEHFTDEDIMDLADVLAFTTGKNDPELTFRLEELPEKFLAPLRDELEQGGVQLEADVLPAGEAGGEGSTGCPQLDGGG